MSTTTPFPTCTIGPDAVTGARCGAPAVTSFTTRDGATFHECAAHAASVAPVAVAIAAGTRVHVDHCGVAKVGTVVKVGRVNVTIDVPTFGGTRTRRISRPTADCVVAR